MEEYIPLSNKPKKMNKSNNQIEDQPIKNSQFDNANYESKDIQKIKELNKKKKQKQREKEKQKKREQRQLKEEQQKKQDEDEQNINEQQVFISGLPYEADEEQIQGFFKGLRIINMKLPRYQDSGRLMGYGHLIFKTKNETEKALLFNKHQMGNRYIEVQLAKGEKNRQIVKQIPPENCKTIFVRNLNYEMTEDDLGNVFRFCGEILNVRIARNYSTKVSKGFGYVDFKENFSLKKALEMDGKIVNNRKIQVDFDTGQMKTGFRLNISDEGNTKYNQKVQEIQKKINKKQNRNHKEINKIKNISKNNE